MTAPPVTPAPTTSGPETGSPDESTWHRWKPDLEASLVVFLVALPLSLGIAVASGAPVVAGIIAAVVGGIVAGLIGGVPLVVTGPAAGLVAVVAGLIDEHGFYVTCFITVMAGLVQIALGMSRVARAALAISPAVVHGMLAGIGVTIILGQLHVLLGGESPSAARDSLLELPGQLVSAHTTSALLGLGTIAVTLLWKQLPGKAQVLPGPLVSVAVMTAVSLPFTVDRVELPGNLLSAVRLPEVPETAWAAVLLGVLTVALVASVESVLSAVAVEKMSDRPRGSLDRELIGQGAANSLSGLLGGLPVTGVIVRSSANVRAGARTKWSAVLHAVWVAVFAVLLVGVVRQIPLSVLAGLLVVIGLGLVDLGNLRTIARHGEAVVWLVTVVGVVALNLLEGVLAGVAVSLLCAARRTVFAPITVDPPADQPAALAVRAHSWRVHVQGTLTFVSVPRLARQLARVPAGAPVRLVMQVDYLDHAAAEQIADWIAEHRRGGGEVEIDELGSPVLSRIQAGAPPRSRDDGDGPPPSVAPWDGQTDLLDGVERFQERLATRVAPVLHDLRDGQRPTTLFLTCADSRVVPNLITSSGPGDLFTVRNVGNLVPPYRPGSEDSTLAAVEYAVENLGVATIAVCGHSGCGAMQALLASEGGAAAHVQDGAGPLPGQRAALPGWLRQGGPSLAAFRSGAPSDLGEVDRLGEANVVQQLEHLRTHPVVASALEEGRLSLVGMFFDIATAQSRVLAPSGEFESLARPYPPPPLS